MSKLSIYISAIFASMTSLIVTSCASGGIGIGGDLTGVRLATWNEPKPFGMVEIPSGHITLGNKQRDSIWGIPAQYRDISVDAYWMDRTEITNAQYRQFVYYVRDSIIRQRLADPMYGGEQDYLITEDKKGNPITPRLNWNKPIPDLSRATDREKEAINSVYYVNPVTHEKKLDPDQMLFKYEVYDYRQAALRRNQLKAIKRNLNTDIEIDPNEKVMISKDTAYVDDDGNVIRKTITRPLSSEYDFLNTYIVPIYPDETCWINDFPNARNEDYMRLYFNHPAYDDYPVVGVSWEEAEAFCAWRTQMFQADLNIPSGMATSDFRLPTEAEWEYAARAGNSKNKYPWNSDDLRSGKGCFLGNFKPGDGDYTADGHLITSKVGSYTPNDLGLYDMAGNVAEWTSSIYTESGLKQTADINPALQYQAALKDPYSLKKKVVRGGSWKDVAHYIMSTTRTYEYQNVGRSYIGFRCVRSIIGYDNKK